MKEKAKYRSKVAEAVHEGVRGMHRLGLVDKTTMSNLKSACTRHLIPFRFGGLPMRAQLPARKRC